VRPLAMLMKYRSTKHCAGVG